MNDAKPNKAHGHATDGDDITRIQDVGTAILAMLLEPRQRVITARAGAEIRRGAGAAKIAKALLRFRSYAAHCSSSASRHHTRL
jgi:hypothetical protein